MKLSEKLSELEAELTTRCAFDVSNFLAAKTFTIFLIVCEHDADIRKTGIQGTLHSLLKDERICVVLRIDPHTISEDQLRDMVEQEVNRAAEQQVSVDDLSRVNICPVLFADGPHEGGLDLAIRGVQRYIDETRRSAQYQPFLILEFKHRETRGYAAKAIREMRDCILALNKRSRAKDSVICCNRCCVISGENERAKGITQEQQLSTVSMVALMQMLEADSRAMLMQSAIIDAAAAEEKNVFFTARQVSVTAPVRTLGVARMLAAFYFYKGQRAEQEDAFDDINWNFLKKFFEGRLSGLPMRDGRIQPSAVYSVMEVGDRQGTEQLLKEFCQKYYLAPLQNGVEDGTLLKEIEQGFLQEYFLRNGAIENLGLLESRPRIGENLIAGVRKNPPYLVEDARPPRDGVARRCEAWLIETLRKVPEELVQRMLDSNGAFMRSLPSRRAEVVSLLREMEKGLEDELVRLSGIEIALDPEERSESSAERAKRWMDERTEQEEKARKEAEICNRAFDGIVCKMLRDGSQSEDIDRLMDICGRVAIGQIEARKEFMRSLSTSCANNASLAQTFKKKIEQSWLFPLRQISEGGAPAGICIMGNERNGLCQFLREDRKVSFHALEEDDRIEILRISPPFTEESIQGFDPKEGG